jgi:1,2-diacylglycerol 3-alpha-glucosyltransferase
VRVAVLFHRLGPYHCARLEAAARYCDLIAVEVAGETQEYAWSPVKDAGGYSRVTLFPTGDTRAMSGGSVSKRVEDALRDCAADAVAIPGWSDNAAIAALRWCAEHRVPAVLMSESTAQDERRVAWREWIKRRIVDLYSTALVGGQRHIDYLVDLGMPRERVFTGYDTVDNAYFSQRATEIRNSKVESRKQYGLPENYFLASARFIPKKNLSTLLRAYAQYRNMAAIQDNMTTGLRDNRTVSDSDVGGQSSVVRSQDPWHLVLLGDGPLRDAINQELITLNLRQCAHLPGFKQYDELPVYYALANAFVHASTTEQWGLVVNEAMASGLPVLVSNRCGCVPELVREGINGFSFDPDDAEQLGELMLRLSQDLQLPAMGNASREIISDWGTERFATGLKAAAETALTVGLKKPSLLQRVLLGLLVYR